MVEFFLFVSVVWSLVYLAKAVPGWVKRRSGSRRVIRPVRRKPLTPLQVLESERAARRARRRSVCDRVGRDAQLPLGQRPDSAEFAGFVTMVADLWLGRDFTLRARAVGLSWLPYVGKPKHVETAEVARDRLDRDFRLDDEERRALKMMSRKQAGRIAVTAARVADRIHRTPAWTAGYLDRRGGRVDLVAEVTYLTEAAKALAEQERRLGPPPVGQRALDVDVVGMYIEKARVLDSRCDALLARLEGLDALREAVVGVQWQADRQGWVDGVGEIDDLDVASQAVADEMYAQSLRDSAVESAAWGAVAVPTCVSPTVRLTAKG